MKDVMVGDKVLAVDSNDQPFFDEVIMLLHRNHNSIVEDYVQITTDTQNSVVLSRYHLIFVSKTQTVFSKDVKIGQNIYIYNSVKSQIEITTVTNISYVTKTGVYAPLTRSGTIIVDNVYASCYAMFPSHRISHAVFYIWRTLYNFMRYFQPLAGIPSKEIHWFPDLFRKTLNMMNIFSYKL